MKRFCLFSIVLISFILSCCTATEVSRDDIDKIYGEIDALKTQVSQINTNISSMQTVLLALQSQDYVTAVTPISRDGVEIGFTINFQKSGAVTIYHGRDGKDGKDGRDGQDGQSTGIGAMPVIGVRQHTDGQWYWTLNGEWLKDDAGSMVRANGRDGQDGKDGEPGQPGTPGEDGAPGNPGSDGSDGVTPQLKIENSYWYISYDEGSTWKMVGPATGEAGASGDAMFQNVNTGNADYVLFTLIDGTQIKIPTWTSFSALKEQCGRMNSDVVTLQSIVGEIQKGGYITAVNTVYDGLDETGYLLSFNDGRTITVHHGKNGRDGRDAESTGAGGSTVTMPAIGARQHTDGRWYWTIDGEWLKDDEGNMVCANGQKGEDGQPGTPGTPGQPGEPGQPGAAGKDGITPELKIESDYWYVSYDSGTNWTKLGKATGEPGAAGESGTSLFKSVDAVSSDQYVSLFLADNTEIKLQRYSGLSIELTEQNEIEIAPGQNVTISYLIKGASGTPKVSVASVDGWHASIHKTDNVKGTISVTAPNPYMDGCVTVFASEGTQTVMEVMTFKGLVPEAVDLGLSVKWASYNVGATRPEDYGDYFAWGETETYYEPGNAQLRTPTWNSGYSAGYDLSTYKWCNGSCVTMTKYCTNPLYGTVDNKTILDLSDDVAHVKWGGNWRMPTQLEWTELITNCTWTWTKHNGVNGFRVTSKKSGYTSKSIFIPASGRRDLTFIIDIRSSGDYWSSSLDKDVSNCAYELYFYSDYIGTTGCTRFCGLPVRPVSE